MSAAVSMYVPTALVALLATPLALRLIPPNRFYGFRTAQTLADSDIWFKVNRVAGFALIVAALLAASIYRVQPALADGRSVTGMLVLLVPLFAALAAASIYARILSRNERRRHGGSQ